MNDVRLEPRSVASEGPDSLDPHWRWNRARPAPGHTSVDFEVRVDFRLQLPIATPANANG